MYLVVRLLCCRAPKASPFSSWRGVHTFERRAYRACVFCVHTIHTIHTRRVERRSPRESTGFSLSPREDLGVAPSSRPAAASRATCARRPLVPCWPRSSERVRRCPGKGGRGAVAVGSRDGPGRRITRTKETSGMEKSARSPGKVEEKEKKKERPLLRLVRVRRGARGPSALGCFARLGVSPGSFFLFF